MNKTFTQKNFSVNSNENEKTDNKRKVAEEPGKHIISNILNYSKALSITKSKNLEHIEIVLN